MDQQDTFVNDRFRVKFTVYNTVWSVIQKEVGVHSVAEGIICCEFSGRDPGDVI